MTSKTLSFRISVLAAAVAAGAAVRYGLIEFKAIRDFCAADMSAPCQLRSHVMIALMDTPALGLLALGLGFLALFGDRRALVIAAIVTGGFGLFLYNTGLAACGLLLGALRAVRD